MRSSIALYSNNYVIVFRTLKTNEQRTLKKEKPKVVNSYTVKSRQIVNLCGLKKVLKPSEGSRLG